MLEWIRFLAGAALLVCGLGIFTVELIGVYRFKYVLNRMHAAAMGDTLGIGFSQSFNFVSAWYLHCFLLSEGNTLLLP